MTPETVALLTNREVIAIDQDTKAMQGDRVWAEGEFEIWSRPLAGGAAAVGIVNRQAKWMPSAEIETKFSVQLGISRPGASAGYMASQGFGSSHEILQGVGAGPRSGAAEALPALASDTRFPPVNFLRSGPPSLIPLARIQSSAIAKTRLNAQEAFPPLLTIVRSGFSLLKTYSIIMKQFHLYLDNRKPGL